MRWLALLLLAPTAVLAQGAVLQERVPGGEWRNLYLFDGPAACGVGLADQRPRPGARLRCAPASPFERPSEASCWQWGVRVRCREP